jgi:PAS domain S-box-containing protein
MEVNGLSKLIGCSTEKASMEIQLVSRVLAVLLDIARVGVVVCNSEGTIVLTNTSAETVLGGQIGERIDQLIQGRTLHFLDGTLFPVEEMPLLVALEQGKTTKDAEILIRRANGEERVVLAAAAPLRDSAGTIVGAVATFEDINTRRQVKQEQTADHVGSEEEQGAVLLEADQARFQAVFEGGGMGISLLDTQGRVLESNSALQGMVGYSTQEMRELSITELFNQTDGAEILAVLGELVSECDNQGRFQAERLFIRKDGQHGWANLTMSAVRQSADSAQFVVVMLEDITARKQAQAALVQSERLALLGRLAASLAHEINNPLQSVIGCLELVESSEGESEDVKQLIQVATEELERAAGIVTRLRDLGQPSDPADREVVDVNELVEHVVALTTKECRKRQVEVDWQAAGSLPPISLVPDRMQQVFLNLVLNAVEAMPGGGRLEISTNATNQPPGVSIVFSDTGQGIELGNMTKLFDPFYTTKTNGLGLGLYVSHGIVDDHGGHMEAESRLGEGSRFTVWLPT